MVDVTIPTQLLAEAGLVDTGRTLPSREATSWLVRHESGLAVLRQRYTRRRRPATGWRHCPHPHRSPCLREEPAR
jgi:hypothetical protein